MTIFVGPRSWLKSFSVGTGFSCDVSLIKNALRFALSNHGMPMNFSAGFFVTALLLPLALISFATTDGSSRSIAVAQSARRVFFGLLRRRGAEMSGWLLLVLSSVRLTCAGLGFDPSASEVLPNARRPISK